MWPFTRRPDSYDDPGPSTFVTPVAADAAGESLLPDEGPPPGRTWVEDDLPPLGSVFAPGGGWRRHLRLTWRGGWLITSRNPAAAPGDVRELSFCRGAGEVVRRFQQARREECEPGSVVEVSQAAIGGWRLVDRAPWLRFTNATEVDPNREMVWGQNGEPIGVTWPQGPGTWYLMVRDPAAARPAEFAFSMPSRFRDGVHRTRTKAIEACAALVPESAIPADDGWLQNWPESVQRFRDANIPTTFNLNVLLLGPTGVTCTAPGCEQESMVRITRSGTDVGVEARMACYDHAGEALARQSIGGPTGP